MAIYPKRLEKAGTPPQCVLGQYRIAEARFHQALDGLGIFRFHYDHPDFPDAISILGDTEGLRMHYFDARGVHRLFELTVADDGWTVTMDRQSPAGSFAPNDAPFAQRMTYTLEHEDQTITGKGQLSHDDVHWEDDLEVTFRRTS